MSERRLSLLDKEAMDIMKDAKPFILPSITAILHTVDKDINITHFINLRVESNFNNNITDLIYVEFVIGLGMFKELIFNNKDKLEMTILLENDYIKNANTVSSGYKSKFNKNNRYKFILINSFKDSNKSSQDAFDPAELDKQEIVTIKGQLVDPLLLALKNIFISGCYHDVSLNSLVKAIFNRELTKVKVLGRPLSYRLNVVDFDNTEVYRNIKIDPFTKLIKLPYTLQNDSYGIYNNGIGLYFTNMRETDKFKYDINIYPLFDFNLFNTIEKRAKLIFYNPKIDSLGVNEYNFLYRHGIYKTIVTDIEFKEELEKDRFKNGTGLIESFSTNTTNTDMFDITDDTISYFDSAAYSIINYNNEIADYSSFNNTNLDANTYRHQSSINKNKGRIGVMKFPKLNPENIYPYMPFKYVFLKNGKVMETTGTIQQVSYFYDYINKTSVVVVIGLFNMLNEEE